MKRESKILMVNGTMVVISNSNNLVKMNSAYTNPEFIIRSRYVEQGKDQNITFKLSLIASFFDKKGKLEDACQFSINSDKQSRQILLMKENFSKSRYVTRYKVFDSDDLYGDMINYFDSLTLSDKLDEATKKIVCFTVDSFKHKDTEIVGRPEFVASFVQKLIQAQKLDTNNHTK